MGEEGGFAALAGDFGVGAGSGWGGLLVFGFFFWWISFWICCQRIFLGWGIFTAPGVVRFKSGIFCGIKMAELEGSAERCPSWNELTSHLIIRARSNAEVHAGAGRLTAGSSPGFLPGSGWQMFFRRKGSQNPRPVPAQNAGTRTGAPRVHLFFNNYP